MNTVNELNIELSEDIAQGSYSNLAIITHSSSEFIIDFVRMMPGVPKPKVSSRVIMTAENSKRLLMALRDNVEKFENQFGEIEIHTNEDGAIPMAFGNNSAEA
ncbi:hypothetical protein SDC9_31192 [bioreactor metagenome]|jgi:hypothetical protein|uniref:DUF3467 domain-containing protein n=1 Tax=bioreactor metagenome TaxID=1076179 RepID=A0A644V1Y3_9ZZZZ|nr:DUF3467 domain-containing protein [Bacteroidales bacterium]MBP9584083.1 DUF3467 domain-containing protein [Bacteroidales bacterium]MBP9977846.1 DUF3467 domain-containing protein [Bacteroidales bacterium]WRQ33305.1 DUF3467 domain-containing protein [Bacteroidales bacterium MB20-C3-3]